MGPTRKLNADELEKRKQKQVLEKDETERQLEKILFGDQAGFLSALNSTALDGDHTLTKVRSTESQDEDQSTDEGMHDVADDDLFFLDAGTADLPDDVMEDLQKDDTEIPQEDESRKILWQDSDDERITVSLASNTRLRKLRDTEGDDVVNGLEYIQRLRRQYERLHPTPDWVYYARKKRKVLTEDANSDSDSDVDISVDSSSVKSLSEILRSAGSLTRSSTETTTNTRTRALKLRPEVIDIQRQKDIASSGPSSVDTIEFHPIHPLLLTAGPSSTVTLYHISPLSQTPNPILTSVHVKNTPLTTATFALHHNSTSKNAKIEDTPETKIYLSARRRYFHTFSLQTNDLTRIKPANTHQKTTSLTKSSRKNHELPTCELLILSPDSTLLALISNTGSTGGTVYILSTETHQSITQCRIDSLNGIASVVFYKDSSGFSVVGKNGEVSEYSLSERRVIARWIDDGAVGTTIMAMGGKIKDGSLSTNLGTDRYVAIGSTSGIVNIYDRLHLIQHFNSSSLATTSTSNRNTTSSAFSSVIYRPKPLRTFDHLTTPVSHLHFSPDPAGQLLVMASRWKKNALRLIHSPSCTVYKNWPTDKTPLGRISSVAISPDGGHLAVGNEAGKVRLWQVRD